jgi:mRNA interferase MazF
MPRYLRCRNDVAHASFKGLQHVCCEHIVELDPQGVTVKRILSATLHDLSDPDNHMIVCAVCGTPCWLPPEPINFVPPAGQVLLCDFSTGFQVPEMIKVRPVVVISERNRNRQTCIVVPVSSSLPNDPDAVFVELDQNKYAFFTQQNWAKCEMVNAVRRGRLYRLRDPVTGRGVDSRQTAIDAADLQLVRAGVRRALGLP